MCSAAVHADLDQSRYQPELRARLASAAEVPGWRYVRARTAAAETTASMSGLLAGPDAVVLPTAPIVAPPLDATEVETPAGPAAVRDRWRRNTRLASLTGHAALSLPLPAAGLPIGLQVLAADNQRAWAAAGWIEAVLAGLEPGPRCGRDDLRVYGGCRRDPGLPRRLRRPVPAWCWSAGSGSVPSWPGTACA